MDIKPGYPYRFDVQDEAFKELVQKVLARIPAKSEEFPVFGIIQTAGIGGKLGHVDSAELVQFDVEEMNRLTLSVEAKVGVIAHEFAHLFLQHMENKYSDQELEEMEKEANGKASEWGFEKEIQALYQARGPLKV